MSGVLRAYPVAVEPGGTPALSAIFDTDAWARHALELLAGLPGVARVGLALSEGGGRRHLFTADDRADDGRLDWCHVDAYDDVPLNTVARTGEPVFGSLDELESRYPGFVGRQRQAPYASVAAVPFVAAGQVVGGFVLFLDRPQPFTDRQRRELQELGAQLGIELRRAQGCESRTWTSLAEEPVPPGARVALHDVPPDLRAVGESRREMARTLAEWGVSDEVCQTAVLCLSELVTNALIHTRSGAEVRVLLEEGVLTTTVRDGGPGTDAPDTLEADPWRVQGRGLQIVDAFASRWGSRLDNVGATVWFVLET